MPQDQTKITNSFSSPVAMHRAGLCCPAESSGGIGASEKLRVLTESPNAFKKEWVWPISVIKCVKNGRDGEICSPRFPPV